MDDDQDGGSWVSLFSGGKDSSFALYRALEDGLDVARLLTVHPEGDSYMYHVPATDLTALAAESIGIELVEVSPDAFESGDPERDHDAGGRGDREVEPMEAALSDLDGRLPGGLAGVETALVVLLVALVPFGAGEAFAVATVYRVASYWFALVVGGLATFSVIARA